MRLVLAALALLLIAGGVHLAIQVGKQPPELETQESAAPIAAKKSKAPQEMRGSTAKSAMQVEATPPPPRAPTTNPTVASSPRELSRLDRRPRQHKLLRRVVKRASKNMRLDRSTRKDLRRIYSRAERARRDLFAARSRGQLSDDQYQREVSLELEKADRAAQLLLGDRYGELDAMLVSLRQEWLRLN